MLVRLLLFLCLVMWSASTCAEENVRAAARFLDGFYQVRPLDPPLDVRALDLETGAADRMRLKDQSGKWTIMNIWATWCAPCIEELPSLDRLKMMRGSPQFDVLAVSIDLNKSGPRMVYFFKRWKIKYLKPLYDDTRVISQNLNTNMLPVTYVINPKGFAIAELRGPAKWASEDALAFIDTIIIEPDLIRNYDKIDQSHRKP